MPETIIGARHRAHTPHSGAQSSAFQHVSNAFAVEGHVWDALKGANDSVAALTAVVSGRALDDFNQTERTGFCDLLDRLVWLQGDLITALAKGGEA